MTAWRRHPRVAALAASVSAIALGTGFEGASAQDASAADTSVSGSTDVIVVSGTRLENARAIEARRSSEAIVDAITADEVGALPDFSLSEALRRIVGVTTEDRNGDAEFVMVRGMPSNFNGFFIDGGLAPTTSLGGRATQLSVVPSFIVSRTDVVKSFTADQDANVIGGRFDLVTRSAFDADGFYMAAQGALGYYENNDAPEDNDQSWRADFVVSNTFGKSDQFGVVFALGHFNGAYQTWLPGVAYTEYELFYPDGANTRVVYGAEPGGTLVPGGAQTYQYLNEFDRNSGFLKLEYRPGNGFEGELSVHGFSEDENEYRWDNLYFKQYGTAPEFYDDTTGRITLVREQQQYFFQVPTTEIAGVNARARYAPDDRQRWTFSASAARSEFENDFAHVRFDNGPYGEGPSFDYDISGEFPVLSFLNPDYVTDPSNFTAIFVRPRYDVGEQDTYRLAADYERDLGPRWQVAAGGAFRSDRRERDRVWNEDWRPASDATRAFSLADAYAGETTFEPALYGDIPNLVIDGPAYFAFFNATKDEWNDNRSDRVTDRDETLINDFEVTEDIAALYGLARFEGERLRANVGLRYERTEVTSEGYRAVDDDGDSTTPFLYPWVVIETEYDHLLPSANLIYDVSDRIRLRAAASKTLGRGDYSEITPNGNETIDDEDRSVSVSSGNPDLKPREATNLDLAAEYYDADREIFLTAGVFHKQIDNEIFTRPSMSTRIIGGETYDVFESHPANANDASVTGIELGAVLNSFAWVAPALADVGASVNYAHIDSSFEIEMNDDSLRELYGLIGQPREIANAAVFWSPGDLELRLAANYRSKRLRSASASDPQWDDFVGAMTTVDARARYNFENGVSVFAEGRNLTDEGEDTVLSYGRTQWTRDYGRSYWLGVRYRR